MCDVIVGDAVVLQLQLDPSGVAAALQWYAMYADGYFIPAATTLFGIQPICLHKQHVVS